MRQGCLITMRKCVIMAAFIVSCIILTFSSGTHARIQLASDDVGSEALYSTIKLKNQPWENIGLWTKLRPGAAYHLELTTDGYKDWVFFDGQVSIQIKDVWHELQTDQQKTTNNWPTVTTIGQYTIPQPAIEALANLKSTDKVELRLTFRNTTYVQWNVPDNILAEWQELIRRTK